MPRDKDEDFHQSLKLLTKIYDSLSRYHEILKIPHPLEMLNKFCQDWQKFTILKKFTFLKTTATIATLYHPNPLPYGDSSIINIVL